MGKRKPDREGGGRPGPRPNPERTRSALVNVRSRPEWRDWLRRFAASERKGVSDLVDEALLLLARDRGFEMPPRR